ncbi:MAG: type III pantothenate kinase [Candidatus Competibacterales bacterium]|nr:type III pantothenate kinase [Candidatus Competibacterales bacterium]
MKLLVDIGNTRLKWIAVEAGLTVKRGHLLHRDVEPTLWGDRLWRPLPRPAQIVVANVAGSEVAAALDAWCLWHWNLRPRFINSEAHRFGIQSAYHVPESLGVDRWTAMIGSRQLVSGHCVIIDCGTAVTIDALQADGRHLGGVILPGLRLMHEALFRHTSQIAEQEMGDIVVLGRNTRDGIWGGSVHAITAAIDRVSGRMADAMAGPVTRLITGGNAPALMPYLDHDYRLEPDLIFFGLRRYAAEQADQEAPMIGEHRRRQTTPSR